MLKIMLPYRDRKKHLELSLNNLPIFLNSKYNNNYELIIVEQFNKDKFNLAKLINIGYKLFSFKEDDCFIYHPIDHWPSSGDFHCPKNSFKILLNYCKEIEDDPLFLYQTIIYHKTISRLRAFSICPKLFERIDGYQTIFEGWGNEDNAFVFKLLKNVTDPNNIYIQRIHWLTDELHDRDKSNRSMNNLLNKDYILNQSKYDDCGLKNTSYNIISSDTLTNNIKHYKVDWN